MISGFLTEVRRAKQAEVKARAGRTPLADLKARIRDLSAPRPFTAALTAGPGLSLIAELKKASPSGGVLREDFDPLKIAAIYEEHGASALSVLTDTPFFQGRLETLKDLKSGPTPPTRLPLLQKDFLLDEYQVVEARAFQADAVLLIVAILEPRQLADYLALAADLGMDALVEVHTAKELEQALKVEARLIGINNRDLDTFTTDLETTIRLMKEVPSGHTVVSESGIETRRDVERLLVAGVQAVLIGEAFMRSPDIGEKMKELLGSNPGPTRPT